MIELKNFTKKYSDFTAVKDLSFIFEEGQITGILGPNGAGKTTILKALTGRHFATEGQVLVNGIDAAEESEELRNRIGFVEETASLPPEYTVKEFITWTARLHGADDESVEKTIELCALEEVKFKKIRQLSKGYRERVNFAQALVYNPQIIILDEPASGLDPQQIVNMRQLVKKLSKDHTIVLSTHLMQEVEALCQKVLIIDRGNLLISGTIEQIIKETGTKTLEEAFFKLVDSKKTKEGKNE